MSELSQSARKDAKAKMERMLRADPHEKVDGTSYEPPEMLNAGVKTGMRPVSRNQYKRGGMVVDGKTIRRGDRKMRASGGMTANELINRNDREANKERSGTKHDGGFKRGGKADGGANVPTTRLNMGPSQSQMSRAIGLKSGGHADAAEDKKLIRSELAKHEAGCKCGKCSGGRAMRKEGGGNWIAGAIKHPGSLHRATHTPMGEKIPEKKIKKAEHSEKPGLAKKAHLAEELKGFHKERGGSLDGELQGTRPTGGRLARKDGGKAGKGKVNVNIVIASPKQQQPMPVPMMPPAGPVGLRQGVPPPPAGGPPMMPPGAAPGAPMPRKTGGRAGHYTAGALSGEGRLQKIKNYGDNAFEGEDK